MGDAARFLGRTYVTPPELEQESAKVEIQKKLNLDAIGCEEVLSQLLYVRGLAVVSVDPLRGIYEVVSLRGSRGAEVMTGAEYMNPDEVLKRASWKVYVLTSVPLTHRSWTRRRSEAVDSVPAGGACWVDGSGASRSPVTTSGGLLMWPCSLP